MMAGCWNRDTDCYGSWLSLECCDDKDHAQRVLQPRQSNAETVAYRCWTRDGRLLRPANTGASSGDHDRRVLQP